MNGELAFHCDIGDPLKSQQVTSYEWCMQFQTVHGVWPGTIKSQKCERMIKRRLLKSGHHFSEHTISENHCISILCPVVSVFPALCSRRVLLIIDINPLMTCGLVPYISAQLHVCRTCDKRSVSTLSETLVLLVFFCFLVVLFFSLPQSFPCHPLHLRKETCILTLIKREKRGKKHQEMEARHSPARFSLTCGHVQPSQRR